MDSNITRSTLRTVPAPGPDGKLINVILPDSNLPPDPQLHKKATCTTPPEGQLAEPSETSSSTVVGDLNVPHDNTNAADSEPSDAKRDELAFDFYFQNLRLFGKKLGELGGVDNPHYKANVTTLGGLAGSEAENGGQSPSNSRPQIPSITITEPDSIDDTNAPIDLKTLPYIVIHKGLAVTFEMANITRAVYLYMVQDLGAKSVFADTTIAEVLRSRDGWERDRWVYRGVRKALWDYKNEITKRHGEWQRSRDEGVILEQGRVYYKQWIKTMEEQCRVYRAMSALDYIKSNLRQKRKATGQTPLF